MPAPAWENVLLRVCVLCVWRVCVCELFGSVLFSLKEVINAAFGFVQCSTDPWSPPLPSFRIQTAAPACHQQRATRMIRARGALGARFARSVVPGSWQHLLRSLEGQPQQASEVFVAKLLSSCISARKWALALDLWSTLRIQAPSVKTQNRLLRAYGAGALWRHACAHLQTMPPDAAACSTCMTACIQGDQWAMALALFAQSEPVIRNIIVMNCAMNACVRGRKLGEKS